MHAHNRLIPLIALLISLTCLLPAVAPAAAADGASDGALAAPSDEFAGLLDERMPGLLAKYGVPGSVVALIEDGDVAWTRAYGVANLATGQPMQPDLLFEHGSNGKALTGWAVAKLVEQGKVDLDAPANRYLKRWRLTSATYDADAATVRQLLSHTSGLNIHGYVDYSPRRAKLPDLAGVLESPHLLEAMSEYAETGRVSLGRAEFVQRPGAGYKYSGAAFTVLQMIVEDVAGEPFDTFVQREVTDPLGIKSVRWAWTPEQRAAAARPYGYEGQVLEYRQLANHAIGSEIATVADFARFVAAAVPGPHGEPAGRGVLRPETIESMTTAQPGTGGSYGLGYGIVTNYGEPAISHSGANSGWTAYYLLDKTRRLGFVVASDSSRAMPLHRAITNVWSTAWFGQEQRDFPPEARCDAVALLTFGLAGLLGLGLLIAAGVFAWQVGSGRRAQAARPTLGGLLPAAPWLLWLLFIWYTVYAPLPVYLPAGFPDFWPSPAVSVLIGVLGAWLAFRLIAACFPRRATQQSVQPSAAQDAARPGVAV